MVDPVDKLTDLNKTSDVDIRAQKTDREMQDLAAIFLPTR